MRTGIKAAIIFLLVAATAAAGFFAFFSLRGKYSFRDEPKREKAVVELEKKSLKKRLPISSQLCRDNLTDKSQVKAYDIIAKSVQYTDARELSLEGASEDDFKVAVNAFIADHPEVFWIDLDAGYTFYEYEDKLNVSLKFNATGDELTAQRVALEEVVEKAVKNAPDNATDYEVELYLNDFIAQNCKYNVDAGSKHTAYGALVNGEAVCDGYSHAFQLLCMRLGIECTVIEGMSDFNNDAEDGHMWNCIELGGDWYHIDVTWNDSAKATCEAEHYFYFNLTEEQISRDHSISGGYADRASAEGGYFNVFVPKCNSTKLNYAALNFVTIKDPDDDDQIIASLVEAARSGSTYCAYVIDESVDFKETCKKITESYAASWLEGADHYTGGILDIDDGGQLVFYENKRVLAIPLKYE